MTTIVKLTLAAVLAALTAGCATSDFGRTGSGGAVYQYKKTADGCEVNITSAREVSGATVDIGSDCTVTVRAEQATGAADSARVIQSLVDRIPTAQVQHE